MVVLLTCPITKVGAQPGCVGRYAGTQSDSESLKLAMVHYLSALRYSAVRYSAICGVFLQNQFLPTSQRAFARNFPQDDRI